MWHSFCSQVAYSNQDGEISHEKINNDKRSILYAKQQEENINEYYRNSVKGMIIIAWRKKGRSKHPLSVYYVLAFSMFQCSLFNCFKKQVWFLLSPIFQTEDSEWSK